MRILLFSVIIRSTLYPRHYLDNIWICHYRDFGSFYHVENILENASLSEQHTQYATRGNLVISTIFGGILEVQVTTKSCLSLPEWLMIYLFVPFEREGMP